MNRTRLQADPLEPRVVPALFPTLLYEEHTDLGANFVGGAWSLDVHDTVTDSRSPAGGTMLYVTDDVRTAQPADSAFDFLGAGAGNDVWILPQQQKSGVLYLGWSAEDTDPSDLGSYDNTDGRVGSKSQWITLNVTDVRGPGEVSIWQTDSGGKPVVWVDTADGIAAEDVVVVGAGGHVHYNWGFTAKGVYEVTFQANAFEGDDQTNPTSSGEVTYFFAVDPVGPTNVVPGDLSATFDAPLAFDGKNAIRVTGPDTAPADIEVGLSVTQGVLNLDATDGVVITANGTTGVTLRGVRADVNAALETLTYSPATAETATLTVATSDLGQYHPAPDNVFADSDSFDIAVTGTPPPTVPGVPPTTPPTTPPVSPPGVPPVSPPGVPPVTPPTTPPVVPPVPLRDHILVTTAGSHVRVFDAATGTEKFAFFAYAPSFVGEVRVAVADVTGDGFSDVITAAGPGGGPHVQVFDGVTGNSVRSFFAYAPSFTGGIWVAAADISGDGLADIVTGAGVGGGPHVQAFDARSGRSLRSFFAYDDRLRSGVTVAAGDTDGDGTAEIVTAPGGGGAAHVRIFSGTSVADLGGFFAFDPNLRGGFALATADLDGDGRDEIVVGPLAGPAAVTAFRPDGGVLYHLQPPPGFDHGVRLGAVDLVADGQADIAVASGRGGPPEVYVYDGAARGGRAIASPLFAGTGLNAFLPYDIDFLGGVFVAGN